ncbi:MAG: hypothetical protein AUI12_09495 [Acidobacteria bacterium 13_2_20CM_2_57_6]|nr:MAG: hypothetical protein AUI12_09495 [Acidobacteria bacterium 13_2_20CM_2_57_6]
MLLTFPRYNQIVLGIRMHSRFASVTLSSIAAFWAAGCAVPIGPGYAIEKQQVRVQFVPAPEPRIRIDAEYTLKNTGNQPLSELELRLPGRRRFHFDEPRATWDATTLTIGVSTENPRNAVIALPQPWTKSARHMLHLSVDYLPAPTSEGALSFSSNAFFLPAQGWSPELLPTRGLFATGGVPPKKWELSVRVPEGFLVHTSGRQTKASRKNGEMMVFASQGANDHYPFVIAGRYGSSQIDAGGEKINLWTKKTPEAAKLKELSEALLRATKVYDEVFGARTKERSATWIVECPVATGCFTLPTRTNAVLLGEKEGEPTLAEMVSADTLMAELRSDAPRVGAVAAPSLAASWLGYAQNPGFFEQEPPLSALPAFAASIVREAAEGTDSRAETIRRALQLIPEKTAAREPEDQAVARAKSFLFFYALQDRYGREAFRKAMSHMLQARRERGLELSDLIAAFDQEANQNAAEFVRLWMKRPGVPEEFRARYREGAAAPAQSEKETAR